MTFANAAERNHEPRVALFIARLVGVDHRARIEQRCGLKGIFGAEIGTDQ